jgi:hypothetical protein
MIAEDSNVAILFAVGPTISAERPSPSVLNARQNAVVEIQVTA